METSVARKTRRKKLSFIARLNEACAAVPAMDKLGTNNPDYNYVRASQLYEAFRKELFARDILLLPDEQEVVEYDVPTPAGPILNRVTLKVEYELRDCRSNPEPSITKHAYGSGIDHGDKAIYKAKTGAMKYFFRALGIIPWVESNDPEFDLAADAMNHPELYEHNFSRKVAGQKRLADRQVRAFDSACHHGGKTAQQVSEYLATHFKVPTVGDLMRNEFDEAMKWACGNEEQLAEHLASSVAAVKSRKKPNGQPIVAAQDVTDPEEQLAGD